MASQKVVYSMTATTPLEKNTTRQYIFVNPVAFMVLPVPFLDTQQNQCDNGKTAAPDKLDYRSLNPP
jgi:hypothetical protein